MEGLQIKQIRNLLIFSYNNVIFWKEKFENANFNPNVDFNKLEDIQKITTISKTELQMAFPKLCSVKNVSEKNSYLKSTSGSTGIPFKFHGDIGMLNRRLAIRNRFLDWYCGKPRQIIKIMKSNHPGLESEGILFSYTSPRELEQKKFDLYPLIASMPVILESLSSFLIHLAKLIKNDRINHNIKAVIAAAEPLSPEESKFIKQSLGCPVFRSYGTKENMTIAQECEFGNFHINSEWLYLEIVDERGYQLPHGHTGNIAITMFENKIMPFIRYLVGDQGKIIPGPCACGRTLPILTFKGRLKEIIILPNGKQSHFLEIGPAIWQFTDKIKQYQVVQETEDKIVFNIVSESEDFFKKDIKDKIIHDAKNILGKDTDISISILKEIPIGPDGKKRTFVSRLE
ncbi:MAG: Capsular polysaccharide biosynthesis protein [Candidatus Azambacteria bacterium GW2011_GWB1_42_17]|nr:MAG: Capsular polysaccharide biosynthesis protein [Candidatus Azambacteria bacterium GW2011_GWB1_42_17]